MDRGDILSSQTTGGKFGCFASGVTAILLSVFVLAPLMMGDCLLGEECEKHDLTSWLSLAGILLISGAVGIVVRQLVNRFVRR
jgi:hypothetical protein